MEWLGVEEGEGELRLVGEVCAPEPGWEGVVEIEEEVDWTVWTGEGEMEGDPGVELFR